MHVDIAKKLTSLNDEDVKLIYDSFVIDTTKD
jgi:hypothetical protein